MHQVLAPVGVDRGVDALASLICVISWLAALVYVMAWIFLLVYVAVWIFASADVLHVFDAGVWTCTLAPILTQTSL